MDEEKRKAPTTVQTATMGRSSNRCERFLPVVEALSDPLSHGQKPKRGGPDPVNCTESTRS
jgi:hypothetical protein